jgi:polyferredoxin
MRYAEESVTPESRRRYGSSGLLLQIVLLAAFTLLPPLWSHLEAPSPQRREIHIETFRYGFNPSRIHVNRGDRVILTFSTRDTGHSFFLQDYDLHVVITPGNDLLEIYRLSRPNDSPVRARSVELTAGMPGWAGFLVSKSQFRNHVYNGPMHGTERGDLIVGPNYLLSGGLGLLLSIPLIGLLRARPRADADGPHAPSDLLRLLPRLKRVIRKPFFQFSLVLPMLAVFYFLILSGFVGTKVAGRNAGSMVVWALWLPALILVLVPLGGRLWCLACPVPLLGEWLQRRRIASSATACAAALSLPAWLRNPWPSLIFFLLLGTFSSAIIALPPATSWLLTGLVLLALATSVFSEQRIFCRYLCPIKSYISLYSMTGRLAMRSASELVCLKCEEHFCLSGSAKGWGCPYGLCMGEVRRNNECGMCTECIKTCAYDNVSIFWRRSGWDRELSGRGEAWQAVAMFGLALVYCIVNLGAWYQVRDWIDIVDKRNWGSFAVFGIALWATCLGFLPGLVSVAGRLGALLSGIRYEEGFPFRTTAAGLVPMGTACWGAFAIGIALSMTTFVLQSLSDPFGWGWNLLGMAGSAWHIIWAPAIPWIQVSFVVAGFVFSLRTLYLNWYDRLSDAWKTVIGVLPGAMFLWVSAAGMVWFFAG